MFLVRASIVFASFCVGLCTLYFDSTIFLGWIMDSSYGGRFWKRKNIILVVATLGYLSLASLFSIQDYNMYTNPFGLEFCQIERFVVRTAVGICGSMVMLILIRTICDRMEGSLFEKQIAKIGTYTLGIYIFQYEMFRFGNMFMVDIYDRMNIFKDTIYERAFLDIGLCLPTSIFVIFLSILIIKILRKQKYLRLIFLGEK